jgi:hypothetical protein
MMCISIKKIKNVCVQSKNLKMFLWGSPIVNARTNAYEKEKNRNQADLILRQLFKSREQFPFFLKELARALPFIIGRSKSLYTNSPHKEEKNGLKEAQIKGQHSSRLSLGPSFFDQCPP